MSKKETLGFQTEVNKLLHLMIHSLYSNKEIFLRELISNASDAIDKLRFMSLNDAKLAQAPLIRISTNKDDKTITIEDSGIGMNRDDVINHLGTIAKSGTAEFLKNLEESKQKDASLIGQFGVGFYSSFIVANRVEVFTRKAGEKASNGVYWESSANDSFTIENIKKDTIGTKIVLHLNENSLDFLESYKIKSIISKYSNHLNVSIEMLKEQAADDGSDNENNNNNESKDEQIWEVINDSKALWTIPKNQLKDEDYNEFYKTISHDYTNPIVYSHNKVEGKLEYTSLLYIPAKAPYDLYQRDAIKGLKLYVQKVFIMDSTEEFLPLYLRFVKGIVDSNDLSLNVSREILQKDQIASSMKTALTKRVLDMLDKLSEDDSKYVEFYKIFGNVLKEGIAEDFSNKEKIAKLLRFASTTSNTNVSFEKYIERNNNDIYYLTGSSYEQLINNPILEVFKKKNIEVLLLSDHIDEWMISYLHEFAGKKLVDISREDINLTEDKTEAEEEVITDSKDLLEKFTKALENKVEKVQISKRLVDSPAALVLSNNALSTQMRQILQASGQSIPEDKPILEINPNHPLILKFKDENSDRFKELAEVIFEQSQIAAGRTLKDPGSYVIRVNKLLLDLV